MRQAPPPSDLAELWRPFINNARPLIIAIGNPLFLQFENKDLYRDLATENAEQLLKSPNLEAIRKLRRTMVDLNPIEAMETLTAALKKHKTNDELLAKLDKG